METSGTITWSRVQSRCDLGWNHKDKKNNSMEKERSNQLVWTSPGSDLLPQTWLFLRHKQNNIQVSIKNGNCVDDCSQQASTVQPCGKPGVLMYPPLPRCAPQPRARAQAAGLRPCPHTAAKCPAHSVWCLTAVSAPEKQQNLTVRTLKGDAARRASAAQHPALAAQGQAGCEMDSHIQINICMF